LSRSFIILSSASESVVRHQSRPASGRNRGAADLWTSAREPCWCSSPAPRAPGLREWVRALGRHMLAAGAFDCRAQGLPLFTGRASKRISKALRGRGLTIVAKPEGFVVVSRDNHLVEGEASVPPSGAGCWRVWSLAWPPDRLTRSLWNSTKYTRGTPIAQVTTNQFSSNNAPKMGCGWATVVREEDRGRGPPPARSARS
jgi:hypothetical protein